MSVKMTCADIAARFRASGSWLAAQRMRPDRLAAVCAISIFSLFSFVWIMRDMTVWPWDQAWYGEVALDLRFALSQDLSAWANMMLHAFGSKPPLISWLTQFFTPLSHVLGRTEPALLVFNVLIQAAVLVLVYRVGRRLDAPPRAALAGMLTCGGASLFIGLTNQFFVETLQTLTTAGLMSAALGAERRSWVRVVADVVLWTALSFLTKASAFTYVVPLVTYIVVASGLAWNASKPRPTRYDYWLASGAAASAIACAAWYYINWTAMVVHFQNSTTNELAQYYGSIGTLGVKLDFWIRWLGLSLSPWSWVLLVVAILFVAAFGLAGREFIGLRLRAWPQQALDSAFLFVGALAGIIVITIFGLAIQINEETRFLAPLIPIMGGMVAWSLRVVDKPWLTRTIAALFGFNALVGAAYAQGVNPLGVNPTVWLKPVQNNQRTENALTLAVDASCTRERPDRYALVGVEYPWFNANSAAFFSAKSRRRVGYRCYYTSLGYAQIDIEAAVKRIDELDPDFVITIAPDRQLEPVNFVNRVSKPFAVHMATDPRFKRVEGIPGDTIIYQRLR